MEPIAAESDIKFSISYKFTRIKQKYIVHMTAV